MGLKLLHLHLHGLIRSHDLELGRDSDTGGQTLYVLELVKELAASKEVQQVDLVTRLVQDRKISAEYAQPREQIAKGAQILRIPFCSCLRVMKDRKVWNCPCCVPGLRNTSHNPH